MQDTLKQVEKNLEEIAIQVADLKAGDVQAIGIVMNTFSTIEDQLSSLDDPVSIDLIIRLNRHLESVLVEEDDDFQLLNEGICVCLSICQSLQNYETNDVDVSLIIEKLEKSNVEKENGFPEEVIDDGLSNVIDSELSQEDKEIFNDFISESRENLELIELNLIDLEQEPNDKEIMNAIFRPFHTIKGVSGFLELKIINRLAHSTENLLDNARTEKIIITNSIADIILESVDTIKKLLDVLENGVLTCEAVENDSVDIEPLIKKIESASSNTLEEGQKSLGEILVEKGTLDDEGLKDGLAKQKEEPGKKLGEILLEEKIVESKDVISALRSQKTTEKALKSDVKVDTLKLDNLVDFTGELVISQTMLRQKSIELAATDQKLFQNLNQLSQIVSSIQKIAMSMRMVPIKSTFRKMVRLVRDLSRNSGKEIALEMTGEDTEIDRNVVDALYEPMVHMIRNSVDHGLESPEQRIKAGKDKKGTIHLKAYHKGGNIVIEIIDNGRGLNTEKILEKAVTKNLISSDAVLSDSEIYSLIMKPGFSTADKITDISGRGVGMDVVKDALENLQGRIDVESKPGAGTTFILSLPLTLAIIDGMLVRVGSEKYIIPTMAILESFKPGPDDCHTVNNMGEMVMVRGNLLPLIRIDDVFNVPGEAEKPENGLVVVVENNNVQKGLLLDELLGKDEFVIKNLGESIKGVKGLAGGTILGDGRVGLILDVAGIFEAALVN